MQRFHSVLLSAWREAARHIEISESASNLAALLADHLPLDFLLVRRIEPAHRTLETIAVGSPSHRTLPLTKTAISPGQLRRMLAWGREGTVLRGERSSRSTDLAAMV